MERVQKAATNLVPVLRKYNYATRLRMIGITSLEERRLRGDMIEVYKLLTGKEQIDHRQFFNSADTPYGLRGHEKKLAKDRSRLDSRKFFFSQRVAIDGTIFRQKSSTRKQLTASRTHTTTTTAKIWTTEADQLPVHQPTSTSKDAIIIIY